MLKFWGTDVADSEALLYVQIGVSNLGISSRSTFCLSTPPENITIRFLAGESGFGLGYAAANSVS